MIRNSKQDWSIGKVVRIGFQTYTVVRVYGNEYIVSRKGLEYSFTPHQGLEKL